jgi:hypothetical protein
MQIMGTFAFARGFAEFDGLVFHEWSFLAFCIRSLLFHLNTLFVLHAMVA